MLAQTPSLTSLLQRVWSHIAPRRRVGFFFLLLLMLVASVAEVASIGAILPFLGVLTAPEGVFDHPAARPLIDALGLTDPGQILLPLTAIFILTSVVSGVLRLALLWVQTRMSHAVGADFSMEIYRRTLYQPYAVHIGRNSSEVIAGITAKASAIVNNTLLPVLTIISSSMMLVGILFALIAIDPVIALSAFAGFALIYLLVISVTKRNLARDSLLISRESTQVVKALQEGMGGIRDILLDGSQDVYCRTYQKTDLLLRRAQANVQIVSSSPRFGIESLAMIMIALLAYVQAGRAGGVAHTIPVLGALALGAQRLLPVLQQIYLSLAAMRGGQVSLADALDLLDQPLPVSHAEEYAAAPLPFCQYIVLRGLGFRYAVDEARQVLHDLDLLIAKGSRIGFIGTTGSGKSTLLDIVMGLLEPTEGDLLIDNQVITEHNRRAWQRHIAHVPQSIFLSDATVSENIAFGVPLVEIDMARVREAARKAQIDETIEAWPEQYDAMVGEGGVRLSGGQRQRIGIARALYKQADVIVLDEATSALDNDTERAVMRAIEQLGDEYTIIIVAHRLSTLSNCTHIVELNQGRIRRTGSYPEIIGLSV